MTPRLLALRGASVTFGDVMALRDADLAIDDGDVVAIVGANGSGKTTLLRALHGVVRLTGAREVSPGADRRAMIFQRPFLLRLSVWNNLRIALWLARRTVAREERSERAAEALRRVGLLALRDRPARSLSGGEQQRLALARAWAVRPKVLLLDEPTASLDPSARKQVESLLGGFAAEGMTLVLSTHNLDQVRRLATRVIYMDSGRIAADVSVTEFFAIGAGRADLFLKGNLPWSLDMS